MTAAVAERVHLRWKDSGIGVPWRRGARWFMVMTAADQEVRSSRHLLVSERLRVRRHQLGLTQKQVVTRLRRIGVVSTNKALSSLEHGSGLDVGKLPELAEALDCTVTWLLGLTDDPHCWEPDGDGSGPDRQQGTSPRPVQHTRPGGRWVLGPLPGED